MTRVFEVFASRSDWSSLLAEIEAEQPLQYVESGLKPSEIAVVRSSYSDIEDLGIAKRGDQNLEPIYLVMVAGRPVVARTIPQRRGGALYSFGPEKNPASIVMKVGGEFGGQAIIAGQLGTRSDDPESLDLIKLFGKAIRRRFKKVRSFWVGEGAYQALIAGFRLNGSISAPPETDLRP